MERKSGWTYSFIDSLNMNIAINDQTGILYTEDKIRYSKEEQEILKEFEYQIPLEVHLIKKLFGGTILKIFR